MSGTGPVGNAEATIDSVSSTNTTTGLPGKWHVILINDDYTPMDFVVEVLVSIFHKDKDKANEVTLTPLTVSIILSSAVPSVESKAM